MGEIQRTSNKKGYETISFYGRRRGYEDINCEKFCSQLSVLIHGAITFLFNNHGCGSYLSTKKLIKRLKKIEPDVIQLHNIHGYYLNYVVLFKYFKKDFKGKIFWTFHDCWAFTGHCPHFDFIDCQKWQKKCYGCPQMGRYPISLIFDTSFIEYKRKKKIFNGINNLTIITPSNWLNNLVKKSYLCNYPLVTINNGIDLNVFHPLIDENIKKKYSIPENKKIVLGVANIWEDRKGFEDFIKLSKTLKSDTIIILVGVNNKQKKKLPFNIIGILRTDNQQELVKLYSISDVFVNPTKEDNYPTVNLESIACGTPVVTYDVGGCKEQIIGNVGFVCKSYNELKQKINLCIYNNYKSKKFNNSKCINNLDSLKTYNEYLKIYCKE